MWALLLRATIVPAVLVAGSVGHGQATVTALTPATVAPGAAIRLEFKGSRLTDGLRAVLSRPFGPVRVEPADSGGTTAFGVLATPTGTIGPVGIWATTAAGVAQQRFLLVDDLPAVVNDGANTTLATAKGVTIPASVDGTASAGKSSFFRFRVATGQRVAFEAVTRQAGSPMDPVLRLLDASGRVLATVDDGPAGPECRFGHVFPAAGEYLVELQANGHGGGVAYHLRIGDFPIVSHAMPLAVQRGSAARVGFAGPAAESAQPLDIQVAASDFDGGRMLAAKLPGGASSSWVSLLMHEAPQLVEPPATTPLPIPVGVSGSLESPGARDVYRVQGRAGQTIRFVTRGRSLGCGTVPRLRLVDAAGKVVATTPVSVNDKDPNALLMLEPSLTLTFPTDGDYRLEVDDLARRGGAEFGYFFSVEPAGADVEFKPDPAGKLAFAIEPGEGCAPLELVVRRFGDDRAITLALSEAAGLRLVNPVIPAKATQARVYVAADSDWTPQSLALVRLVARSGSNSPKPVSTAALRLVTDRSRDVASPVGDGGILFAGVPGGAKRFELTTPAAVPLLRGPGKHEFVLQIVRHDPAFKGPIAIDGSLLPVGFAATGTIDGDRCRVTLTCAASPGNEPATLRLLAVATNDQRTTITPVDVPVTWTDPPAAMPETPAPVAAGHPPAFAADYGKAIDGLRPRMATLIAKTAAPLAVRGSVKVTETGVAAFSGGRLDDAGPPLGDAWSVSLWFMNQVAVTARPVTAYLFSRGIDGDEAVGDHLGIGGSFQRDAAGKLLVFNGNARNSVVAGRTVLQPNEWHHAVMVRDGRRVRVYLDGGVEPEIDADLEPTARGQGGFFFGARADNFAPLHGALARLAVFDRPLLAGEAGRLHEAAVGRAAAPAPAASQNGSPQPPPPPSDPARAPTATAPPPTSESAPVDEAVFGPGLHVHPPRIVLDGARDRQQLAITTVDDAGFPCDWTRKARITVADPRIAAIRGTTVFPLATGTTEAVVEAGGRTEAVDITVTNAGSRRPLQFETDLMVALSKQSCSSGACHGSPSGKGGFRLSLRASERDLDALTIVREEFGRRINPIDPEASLLLRKPLMQLPHGGGKQLALGDEAYEVIRDWIAEGGRIDPPDTPRCVRLEVWPGGRQVQRLEEGGRQIVATAHFSDGTRRDVSHLVAYESSAASVATVDARGWVTPKKRGEAVILVRYLEHIAVVPLMFVEDVPGFVWEAPSAHNEIDRLVDDKLRALNYPPAAVCTDSEFVRRVFLDVIGLLPTVEETERFLADTDPDKRGRLIDGLLERDEYARFAALRWGDVLRLSQQRAGEQGVYKYHRWLEDAFRTNKPHDAFARELLLASGSSFSSPPAHFFRTTVDSNETVETVAQLFLGVRLQCAKCHNHPFDRWSQDNYYGLMAFFDRVQKRSTPLAGETFVFVAADGDTKQPRSGRVVTPWLPLAGDVVIPPDTDRRGAFVDWLLAHDNPFFARVEANRIWSQFFARGIVHPVDDFRDSNPPSNGPLLDWLAAEFTRSGFDRKHLIRTILRSRTYQAASVATAANQDDSLYGSHQLPRLLTAEQMLDAIGQVTGVDQPLGTLPSGSRATGLPAPDLVKLDFLKMLGQPDRGTVCACERSGDSSLGMAIELFNGKLLTSKLDDPASRFRQALAAGHDLEDVLRGLYLAAYCRPPSPDELTAAVARCRAVQDPGEGVEDVCWAVLNSDEFVFQH